MYCNSPFLNKCILLYSKNPSARKHKLYKLRLTIYHSICINLYWNFKKKGFWYYRLTETYNEKFAVWNGIEL